MEIKTYWDGNGKYQERYNKLHKLIPSEGSVANPRHNQALETLRRASNCYYDLFNNGLCNRASEFRRVFGFAGTWIAKHGFPHYAPLEEKMDEFILNADREQQQLGRI